MTFAVEPGEVVGLVGDNGAGKSTLMKTITGRLSRSTAATIRFDGASLTGKDPGEIRPAGIEMIYQDLALARACRTSPPTSSSAASRPRSILGVQADRSEAHARARPRR